MKQWPQLYWHPNRNAMRSHQDLGQALCRKTGSGWKEASTSPGAPETFKGWKKPAGARMAPQLRSLLPGSYSQAAAQAATQWILRECNFQTCTLGSSVSAALRTNTLAVAAAGVISGKGDAKLRENKIHSVIKNDKLFHGRDVRMHWWKSWRGTVGIWVSIPLSFLFFF